MTNINITITLDEAHRIKNHYDYLKSCAYQNLHINKTHLDKLEKENKEPDHQEELRVKIEQNFSNMQFYTVIRNKIMDAVIENDKRR